MGGGPCARCGAGSCAVGVVLTGVECEDAMMVVVIDEAFAPVARGLIFGAGPVYSRR